MERFYRDSFETEKFIKTQIAVEETDLLVLSRKNLDVGFSPVG